MAGDLKTYRKIRFYTGKRHFVWYGDYGFPLEVLEEIGY